MAKKNSSNNTHGRCHKHMGGIWLVLGVLILLNTYLTLVSWAYFIGGILALGGLVKLLIPSCKH